MCSVVRAPPGAPAGAAGQAAEAPHRAARKAEGGPSPASRAGFWVRRGPRQSHPTRGTPGGSRPRSRAPFTRVDTPEVGGPWRDAAWGCALGPATRRVRRRRLGTGARAPAFRVCCGGTGPPGTRFTPRGGDGVGGRDTSAHGRRGASRREGRLAGARGRAGRTRVGGGRGGGPPLNTVLPRRINGEGWSS